MVSTRRLILALSTSLLLTGCAHKGLIEAEKATKKLEATNAKIEARLLKKQKNPTTFPKDEFLPQQTARRIINTDRANQRQCVATHTELVSEVTIRQVEGNL